MTKTTHFIDWTRDDEAETDVTIGYTFSPGRPAYTPRGEYAPIDPPEGPEVEIVSVTMLADQTTGLRQPVELTPAETEKATDWVIENHEDDGDDPDYARERRAEERQDDDLTSGDPDD